MAKKSKEKKSKKVRMIKTKFGALIIIHHDRIIITGANRQAVQIWDGGLAVTPTLP
jgi:hypothetical protein